MYILLGIIFMSVHANANEVPGTELNETRRIFWGSRYNIIDAPYVALIMWPTHGLRCGASIVHPQFLVSAVHCFTIDETFYVKVGTDEINQGIGYEIDTIYLHPEYFNDKYNQVIHNDVAVVKLDGILTYDDRIRPISLAPHNLVLNSGVVMETFGFGKNEGSDVSPYLLRGTVSYIDSTTCSNIFGVAVTPSMMCTDGLTCHGDSGGPLVYDNMLVGIVSFGRWCGGAYPSVYARVSFNRDFIDHVIQTYS